MTAYDYNGILDFASRTMQAADCCVVARTCSTEPLPAISYIDESPAFPLQWTPASDNRTPSQTIGVSVEVVCTIKPSLQLLRARAKSRSYDRCNNDYGGQGDHHGGNAKASRLFLHEGTALESTLHTHMKIRFAPPAC